MPSSFTYLGHSTVLCELDNGLRILIDPWVQNNPACPKNLHELHSIQVVLITHGHPDHMGDVVKICTEYNPQTVIASFEICQWLQTLGVKNTLAMGIGGSRLVDGCWISMVRADHSSSFLDGKGHFVYGGMASGYVITPPAGFTFYHAGDTGLFQDMKLIARLYHPKLAFLPIGDVFTMDPLQAALACNFLDLEMVVPIHWGTFPMLKGFPRDLVRELTKLNAPTEVLQLQPGDSWSM